MELAWLLLLACTDVESPLLHVERTEVPSVLRVSWEDPEASLRWEDDLGWHHARLVEDEDGPMAWIVAAPDTQVVLELTDGDGFIATDEIWTDADDYWVDTESSAGRFSSSTATITFSEEGWTPVIYGPDGTARWWMAMPRTGMTSLRARPVQDGVWVNQFVTTSETPDTPHLVKYGWDGTELDYIEAPTNHHDFVVLDDGTVTWIAWEELEDGFYGDALYSRSPDGTVRQLFSTDQVGDIAAMLAERGWDRVWSNHLSFDGTDYWMSLRNLDQVARISQDGALLHTVGKDGDIEVADPFEGQHGGEHTGLGLLLHDNRGSDGGVRVCEYAIDARNTTTAQLVWSRQPDPSWKSMALGDAIRVNQANTRISWGVFSTLEEVSGDGEVVASLAVDPMSILGFVTEAELID